MELLVKGQAILSYEDENGNAQVTLNVSDIDINTQVHDANRQMGAEYVHILTAEAAGHELEWSIYEYPEGCINHIESPSNIIDKLKGHPLLSCLSQKYKKGHPLSV